MNTTIEGTKEYMGIWITKDGYIRHELLRNRYDEAHDNRKSAYQGSYHITGNHIDYKDIQDLRQTANLKMAFCIMAG